MDASLLSAALEGLELQKKRLEEQIAKVRTLMSGRSSAPSAAYAEAPDNPPAARKARKGPRRKRVLSPEARERIAAAQRKRWASFRKS
jgi:hypothetical protein